MRSVGLLGDDQSITREGTPFARLPSPDPQVLSIAPEPVRDLGLEAEPARSRRGALSCWLSGRVSFPN
jgi:hypothetical protein